ncbi:unnamed protein product [Closterium sp. NIES-64]|nr:unnamed protein product [Closterium sp. NIES-64]
MATRSVLTFDAKGRAVDFEVWVDDLQLFLQCDRADGLSLFDLTSGASPAPPADADSTVGSQWATRDAAARLAVRRHLPTAELTRLPDSLRLVKDHFLFVCPTTLTVDLLEERLLAVEKSIVAVGASRAGDAAPARARGARALEGLAGAVEVEVEEAEGVGVVVGVVARVGALVAAVAAEAAAAVAVGAEEEAVAAVAEVAADEVELVGVALRSGAASVVVSASSSSALVLRTGDRAGEQCGGSHSTQRYFGRLTDAWRHQFPDATEIPCWGELSRAGVAIFDLDYDAILAARYAVSTSDEGECYVCLPPDPDIEAAALGAGEAAALGASVSAATGAGESALSGTTSAQALHTFTLDSGASRSFFRDRTTLTPLSRPVAVSLADPSGGPVLARFSTVLPCPAPPWPSPTCVPCVERRQRAARHSSEFPPTEAPLQTLHMDVWGPARVRGQGHERYFLLVVDDYSRYTSVFPLRSKGDVTEVLIDWIRAAHLQLRESFGSDFPVLRLHCDRGGEFSSARLGAFCRAQGIRQTFTIPASPKENGIAERRIGMVMDFARTSMIHAAAPHFLWPFAVQYATHQLNLQPRVSWPETSPTLRWTGKVGDASAFRVWGSRAFVRDLSADKLSPRAVPYIFLGFPPDPPGWQFYHPTSRRVVSSQDVTFDESVPYYRLFPYRTAPLPRRRSSLRQVLPQ